VTGGSADEGINQCVPPSVVRRNDEAMLIADYIAIFGLVALIGAAAALSERKSH
jgi:hypothetical protein